MRGKTFPKEGSKKLNETIRDLKALLQRKEKEITFLKNEIENIVKPIRTRKSQNRPEPGSILWRQDFLKRFKKEVLND